MDIECEKVKSKIIQFIRGFVKEKEVIIGLSGGIDSSLVCALSVEAIGREKIKALIVKNSRYSEEELNLSRDFAKKLGIETEEIDSTNIRIEITKATKIDELNKIETSTIDARICDILIKTIAIKENRVYLGTINATERLTGWYPKGSLFGDCCPIGGLLKEQEKQLARHLDLKHLIETVSEDASNICSGCGNLPEFEGISYKVLDRILFIYETSKKEDLSKNLAISEISPEIISKIIARIKKVEHKNDIFPNYCKINF